MPTSRFDEVRDYGFADQALALRQRAGLTQRDLGALLGVSERAIGAWEAGLSYPGVMHLRQLIALYVERGAFGAEQAEDQAAALWEAVRAHAPRRTVPFDRRWFAALRGGTVPSGPEGTHLPPARTSFVGRAAELAALARALDPATRPGGRLLTLSGVAGCGKTRLALALAAALSDAYADGAWWVEVALLSPNADGEASATSVALATLAALGLHEQPEQNPLDTLVAHLRTRRLLLVLDNCEHVVAGCATLTARLLSACPDVQILCTSQQALRLADETVWPVAPLAVPAPPSAAPTTVELWQLWQSDAVQLFVERAQTVQPSFALDAQTAATVVEICQRLDGLPLAIELAAARLHVLPIGEIRARLDDRFRLLRRSGRTVADRHHTLETTLDWSYGLLAPAAQALLRRLAVFAGGWEVAAAEAVCAGDGVAVEAVLELLDELLERSLVSVSDAAGVPRYGMLETVRHYSAQQLERADDAAVVRDRHLAWCIALAEQAARALEGPEQGRWLTRLEREHDNLRAALRWSLRSAGRGAQALRLAGQLARFWLGLGHLREGRHWLAEALAGSDDTGAERAWALEGAGVLAEAHGAYADATRLLDESLALWRAVGDQAGTARALAILGVVAERQGDYGRARALLEEALALFRRLNARTDIAATLAALGPVVDVRGAYHTAWALLEEGLSVYRSLGNAWGVANTLGTMAIVARKHGAYDQALTLYEEALELARAVGDRRGIARWLNGLALSVASQGAYERAHALLEESLAVSRAHGDLRSTAASLNDLGEITQKQGVYEQARGLFEDSLALQQQVGDGWGIANSYRNLADVMQKMGDTERAASLLAQSLNRFQALGDRWGIAHCLELGGRLAAAHEHWAAAAQVLAGADAARGSIDTQLDPDERTEHDHLQQRLDTALGADRVAALWERARTLPLDDLLTTLTRATGADVAARADHRTPSPGADHAPSAPTAGSSVTRPPTNLPPARTSFVGRADEVAALAQALNPTTRGGARLLTLTGVAGSGKTRLALVVADAVRDTYPDGVWLVELASLPASSSSDHAAVVAATLSALGLHEQPDQAPLDTLIALLRRRRLLLVLDNCEHVAAACAALTALLLGACADLHILTTSQRALGVERETVWPVAALTVPDPVMETPTPKALRALEQSDAVRLFMERAQAVQPGFVLSARNAAPVVAICRHLDGLPLALELAAARLHVLTVDDLLVRLGDRFRVLRRGGRAVAADRHQTLQATLDWSYGLLDPAEQTLLRRLAVFAGGWELAAAEGVCAGNEVTAEGVLELLDELLERSLVVVSAADGIPRYGLLETVRQYGVAHLERAGETVALRERHLHWAVTLAEHAAPAVLGAEPAAWLAQLEREQDNLRAALHWALDQGSGVLGLRLAAGLWPFWRAHRLHLREGRRWLTAVLALPIDEDDATSRAARARALEGAAWLAEDEHDFVQSAALFAQSAALRRADGQEEVPAGQRINAAMEARATGDYARATALLEETLAQQHARGNRESIKHSGLGLTLSRLALVLAEQGRHAQATVLYEECLALHRDLGDREGIGYAQLGLGDIARDVGETARVRAYCEECLALFRGLGHPLTGFALNNLALAAYLDGDLAQAARCAEESVALFRDLRAGPSLGEVLVTLGRVRGAQGAAIPARADLTEALTLAWAKGPRLVVAAALEGLSSVAVQHGESRQAPHLLGAAARLRQEMGTPVRPADRPEVEAARAAARAMLGEAPFAEAWTTGHVLPIEQIIAHGVAGPENAMAATE